MNDADLYREQGYVHARMVFDARQVDELRGAIDRMLDGVGGTEHDENHVWKAVAQDAVLKDFHNVEYHDAAFTRAATHPRLVELLTQLIGPNVQLHHTKMLVKPPEQGAPFPMHQDYPYFPNELHTMPSASIHLDDTNLDNGCLRVIPDPEDPPVLRDGVEDHVDWGQGLMVAGRNPVYWQRRPRFEVRP